MALRRKKRKYKEVKSARYHRPIGDTGEREAAFIKGWRYFSYIGSRGSHERAEEEKERIVIACAARRSADTADTMPQRALDCTRLQAERFDAELGVWNGPIAAAYVVTGVERSFAFIYTPLRIFSEIKYGLQRN